MDELLKPISTAYSTSRKEHEPLFTEIESSHAKPSISVQERPRPTKISTPEEALDVLRSQPSYDELISTLNFFTRATNPQNDFDIRVPGPQTATITHCLVTEIVPNFWALLSDQDSDRRTRNSKAPSSPRDARLLVKCLQSVTGLNAVINHLRALVQETKSTARDVRRSDLFVQLRLFLNLLHTVLEGDTTINYLWKGVDSPSSTEVVKRTQTGGLLSLVTGGRVLSVAAEASRVLDEGLGNNNKYAHSWVADGPMYSQWIARNVVSWAKTVPVDAECRFCCDLFHRGMSLGHAELLVKTVIDELLLRKEINLELFGRICLHHSQGTKKVMEILLRYMASRFLNALDTIDSEPQPYVSSVAAVIKSVVAHDRVRMSHLISWCSATTGAGLGDGVGIRRAVLAVVAEDGEAITSVFEKNLSQFGDEIYVKHAAILQQEAHAQILLLSGGYMKRLYPIKFSTALRSSMYLQGVSNRIAASQTRSRILGMIVAEALSTLTDKKGDKLNFDMDETQNESSRWLKTLTEVIDQVGNADATELLSSVKEASPMVPPNRSWPGHALETQKTRSASRTTEAKPKAIIEEIDSCSEDEDLASYAKGFDPEDSDDDPTLVQRNKIKPPVYVRDLLLFLKNSENYEKQKLALETAPGLLRRKASYGREVSAHADQLANLLVGVQDKFEMEDFNEWKLQSILALIVSQPKTMAPWIARTFFEGDYSLSQRTNLLVALGLSARELAGYDTNEHQSASSFPSKRLPDKIEHLYLSSTGQEATDLPSTRLTALPSSALDSMARSVTSTFLAPLAVKAADATTGPDILKLQTVTARYKSTTGTLKARARAIPNTTASLLATSFFFPLTAHLQAALRSSRPVILDPSLLSLYLQTLGIIIHATGPSTLSLPQLTSELWGLLLSVRSHVENDIPPLRGWLIAMASLLQVNGDNMQRVCQAEGRAVVETREWVSGVFERTRGEDGGDENDVKLLAAGILIKLGEAIQSYQAIFMGDLIGYN